MKAREEDTGRCTFGNSDKKLSSPINDHNEEEIEEQKYESFVIKDSQYINSPRFSCQSKQDQELQYFQSSAIEKQDLKLKNPVKRSSQPLLQVRGVSLQNDDSDNIDPNQLEQDLLEPKAFTPRKHKYYTYFRSLKNRLTQEKSLGQPDGDVSQMTITNYHNGNGFTTPSKQMLNQQFSNEGMQASPSLGSGLDLKEIASLKKANSVNRVNQLHSNEFDISPIETKKNKEEKIQIPSFSSFVNLKQTNLKYDDEDDEEMGEYDESNIVIDDSDQKAAFFKIQESLKLARIPDSGCYEEGYVKQQIKEYLQNNQSIPFKLKNIYNTPCDPKKDLDFKIISSNNGELKNQIPNLGPQRLQSNKAIDIVSCGSEGEISQCEFVSRRASNCSIPELKKDNNSQMTIISNTKYNNAQNLEQGNGINENSAPYKRKRQNSIVSLVGSGQKKKMLLSPTPSNNSIFLINRQVVSIRTLVVDIDDQFWQQNNPQLYQDITQNLQIPQDILHNINSKSKKQNLAFKKEPQHEIRNELERSQNILEIGVSLFNSSPLVGLSFLMLFGYVRQDSEDVVRFLMQEPLQIPQIYSKDSPTNNTQTRSTNGFLNNETLQSQSKPLSLNQPSPQFNPNFKPFESNPSQSQQQQNPPSSFEQEVSNQNSLSSPKPLYSSIPQFQPNPYQSYLLKRSKQAVTAMLTDLSIAENSELLYQYSTFFNFSSSSFCSALSYFVKELQLENDPEQIDILLGCFAKKFFYQNRQQSTLFESPDAVHMLAFASFMLDIDIHFHKESNLSKLIQEFNLNISGINDGKDFSQDFISNIIENILDKKITHVVPSKLVDKQRQHYLTVFRLLLHERAQLFLTVVKLPSSSNSRPILQNKQELLLFIIDTVAIVIGKEAAQSSQNIRVFSMLSLMISYKNQELLLKPAVIFNKQSISIAKLNQQTQGFVVKHKPQIRFKVIESHESKALDIKLRQLFQAE